MHHPPFPRVPETEGVPASSAHRVFAMFAAVVVAAVLVSFLVVGASRAAFEATTSNTGNVVDTGANLVLTDNDGEAAMFSTAGALPGDSDVSCITVTYASTPPPNEVLIYAAGAPTGALPPHLDLTVEVGTDVLENFDDCTTWLPTGGTIYSGTVDGFATAHPDATSGLATGWTPNPAVPTETVRTFRFTVAVASTADPLTSAGFGFEWFTDLG